MPVGNVLPFMIFNEAMSTPLVNQMMGMEKQPKLATISLFFMFIRATIGNIMEGGSQGCCEHTA